jgi:hypothetical protein
MRKDDEPVTMIRVQVRRTIGRKRCTLGEALETAAELADKRGNRVDVVQTQSGETWTVEPGVPFPDGSTGGKSFASFPGSDKRYKDIFGHEGTFDPRRGESQKIRPA